ncbi:7TM-DISM domain-containing protein [Caryophanon tenue]|uniref:7TM-DISM receptor extracellular domain-containing protein n=1 Tax=Caryophanon tenue TaxID=33978 RepID=A0A1C0Y6R0_9BACL|nr:7TM-DISM domain-containing protein [Caryophanon tenue]OCS82834.1 hypothetical protein A6M13_05395 [Caryophanon tenue]
MQFDEALIGELYTLYIPYAATAYTLYFNGVEQVRMGEISKTEKGFSPQQQVKLHQFTVLATEIVVALQVANFSNMVGGAERAILVGPSDSMIKYYQSEKKREHFILGCFLFMVINMFSLYYFRRQETSYLWVGLIGLFLILWYVFSKDHLIMDIFPNLSWEWMTKLELLIVFLAFAFYNKYISVAYKNYYNQQIPFYSFVSLGILLVLCIFLPVSSIVILFNIASVLIIFFALHVAYMSYRLLRDKQPYARAIVLTNLAFFIPFIQDMFYIQGFINTNYYSIYGFMFFSFGSLVMLNFEHTKKYRESETYNLALTAINQGLEETVEERTRELREKNHQLELLTVRDGLTNIANRRYFD